MMEQLFIYLLSLILKKKKNRDLSARFTAKTVYWSKFEVILIVYFAQNTDSGWMLFRNNKEL